MMISNDNYSYYDAGFSAKSCIDIIYNPENKVVGRYYYPHLQMQMSRIRDIN